MSPRLTRIIATLGPASSRQEVIDDLVAAGVDLFRLNFSHGDRDEHAQRIAQVRKAAASAGRHVAILQDLSGPKIRTGQMQEGGVQLRAGKHLIIQADNCVGTSERISTILPEIIPDLKIGDPVLVEFIYNLLIIISTDG